MADINLFNMQSAFILRKTNSLSSRKMDKEKIICERKTDRKHEIFNPNIQRNIN